MFVIKLYWFIAYHLYIFKMSKSRADEYYLDPITNKPVEWVKSSVPLIRPPSMPFVHNVVKSMDNGSTFKMMYDANGKPIEKYYSQTGGTNKKIHKKSHKKSHKQNHKQSHKQSPRKSRRNYHT